MTPDDDDRDDEFDPSELDPEVRELRERVRGLEETVLRHTAELDQIAARIEQIQENNRATEESFAELRAEVDELKRSMDEIDARYARIRRGYAWLIPLTWGVAAGSIAVNFWRP